MGPDENAPYGYMIDAETGVRRPKLSPGKQRRTRPASSGGGARPGRPPSIEELKSESKAKREDRPPGEETRSRRQRAKDRQENAEIPPFRAGPIAKGVNRQYRKAGRVVRIFDAQIGAALIECATPDPDVEEGESGGSVGEAWEELARTNPRVRAWLHRRLQQGAIMGLFWAHLPLLLAAIPRMPWLRRIPWDRLIGALVETEEEPQQQGQAPAGMPPGLAGMFAGLTPEDMAQMGEMAARFFPGMPPMPQPPGQPANGMTLPMESRNPGAPRTVVINQFGEPE